MIKFKLDKLFLLPLFEILAKISIFLIIPIVHFHGDYYDFDSFSYFINFYQVALPIISLGTIVFISISNENKINTLFSVVFCSLFFYVLIFLLNFLFFEFDFFYLFLLLFFVLFYPFGQFFLVNYSNIFVFLSNYLPKSFFVLSLFFVPLLDIDIGFILYLLFFYFFAFIYYFYKSFTLEYNDFKFVKFYKLNSFRTKSIPIIANSFISLLFLILPKYLTHVNSIFEAITYLQLFQAFFVFIFGVFIRYNIKNIYQSDFKKLFIDVYIVKIFFVFTLVLMLIGYFIFYILNFLGYSSVFSLLPFFIILIYSQFLYSLSYDYLISKDKGFYSVVCYFLSFVLSILIYHFASVDYIYVSLVINAIYFFTIYLISFGIVSFLKLMPFHFFIILAIGLLYV